MKSLVLLLTCLHLSTVLEGSHNCYCGYSKRQVSPRIFGGHISEENNYPWMVSILKNTENGYKHVCGGTIISTSFVLTAAHCRIESIHQIFHVGLHNQKVLREEDIYRISKWIIHEKYFPGIGTYNIALILSDRPIVGPNVSPVCLPNEKMQLENIVIKSSGWEYHNDYDLFHRKESDFLREVDLEVTPIEQCLKVTYWDTRNQFCSLVTGKTICHGYFGGPQVWQNEITGRFTQMGISLQGFGYCTQMAVFVNVSAFLDWIEEHMEEYNPAESYCTDY